MATRRTTSDSILTTAVPADIATAIRRMAADDLSTTSAYVRRVLARHVREARQ